MSTTRTLVFLAALAAALLPVRAEAAEATGAAPGPAAVRTAAQLANLRRLVLDGLASPTVTARVAAADVLVAAWPDSAPILDEALASKSAAVRLEAVNLLTNEALGDMRDRIRARFGDADWCVRRQAVRAARRLDWPEVEPDLMRVAARDPEWMVRQEALRGLEDRGSLKCLRVVLDGFIAERDEERRRRYKRVLVAVLHLDRGDDADAWRAAIEYAERLAAESRVGR